jgi:hypothetical protein
MKLKTLFKKSNIFTCKNGWCQGSYQGMAFLEYVPKFQGKEFACDAKLFIEAMDKLDKDYFFSINEDEILLADGKQEILLKNKNGEILLHIPTTPFKQGDLAAVINEMYKYVTLEYPYIRLFGNGIAEVLSSTRVIRKEFEFANEFFTILAYKVPAKATEYLNAYGKLWLKYSNDAYVIITHYLEPLPNTDRFFEKECKYTAIPKNFVDSLVSTETTTFGEGRAVQHSDSLASNVIENVIGNGVFFTEDLRKGLTDCAEWAFVDGLLLARGPKISVVIGEAN